MNPGQAIVAAERLTGRSRARVIADARGRRHTMVATLVTLLRAAPPSDHEEMILDRAIALLDERHPGVPVLADLIRVLVDAPDELRQISFDRGELERYRDAVEPLVKTLTALLGRGRIGELFSAATSTPMRRDRPVVFDVSSIDDAEVTLQRAALMACWSYGFGAVNIANALADAGLEPRRHYFVILDELWRALRGGRGMVDRVDALTRLNRQRGVGVAMISHTMSDLQALPDEDDRMKARGFVERSGMVACGGLPERELSTLARVVLLGLLLAASALATGMVVLWVRRGGRRGGRVDRAAAHMGRGRDLGALERRGAAATAQRLGVQAPGLTLAKTVAGGRTLYQGWEDCSLDIAGPRTGKTTSRVIRRSWRRRARS
jgi:hypothetical protein